MAWMFDRSARLRILPSSRSLTSAIPAHIMAVTEDCHARLLPGPPRRSYQGVSGAAIWPSIRSRTRTASLPTSPATTEALITWSGLVDRNLIERLPELRLVQRIGFYRGGGDLQAAADRGVAVAVWPHGVLNRVAMHTLMFMVALSRKLLPGHELTIEGVNEIGMEPTFADQRPIAMNWPKVANVDTPANKTLGIVGFGEAGACLAHLAAPLDMEILYYKRTRLSPEQEAFYGVEYAPLDDLLRSVGLRRDVRPVHPRERADASAPASSG